MSFVFFCWVCRGRINTRGSRRRRCKGNLSWPTRRIRMRIHGARLSSPPCGDICLRMLWSPSVLTVARQGGSDNRVAQPLEPRIRIQGQRTQTYTHGHARTHNQVSAPTRCEWHKQVVRVSVRCHACGDEAKRMKTNIASNMAQDIAKRASRSNENFHVNVDVQL